jgi:group I intron endonuclease
MANAGIYKITNKINNKIYIGSASDLKRRWREHKYKLKKGIHPNKHLLSSWQINGEENFLYEVIEIVNDLTVLLERENFYIELYSSNIPEVGYNIRKDCRSQIGYKHTEETKQKMRGRIVSEETRKILSEYTKKQTPYWLGKKRDKATIEKIIAKKKENGISPPWNKGIVHSKDNKEKIFGSRKRKFSKELIEQVKADYLLYNSYTKVAKKYGLDRNKVVPAILGDKLILQDDGFYTLW